MKILITSVFFSYSSNFFFVVEKKILCTSLGFNVKCLSWCDFEENTECWREVKGLEGLPDSSKIISVANPCGGRRLKIWRKNIVLLLLRLIFGVRRFRLRDEVEKSYMGSWNGPRSYMPWTGVKMVDSYLFCVLP